jgi:F-type H+-transporting ATPase subunit delta
MAERATVARPYARAAFAFAQEQGKVAQWAGWLRTASQVVGSEEFGKLAHSPGVTNAQLLELVTGITGDGLDAHGRAFLGVLAENQRINYLPEVAGHFDELRTESENVAEVEIISAVPLDDRQQERLAGALRGRLRRNVRLNCSVDPSLIGGAIVRSGDLLIDGSLKGKLARLETELTA